MAWIRFRDFPVVPYPQEGTMLDLYKKVKAGLSQGKYVEARLHEAVQAEEDNPLEEGELKEIADYLRVCGSQLHLIAEEIDEARNSE